MMRIKRAIGIFTLTLMCLAFAACDAAGAVFAGGGMKASASPVASPSPSPSPVPTPTPTPTAVPTPTPTPEPTPTPDPWADKFHTGGGAYISYKDFSSGPWIYKDATLGIEIHSMRGGPRNKVYYVAEIYARGVLAYRGLSFQKLAKPNLGRQELPYKIARRYDAVLGITADYYTYEGKRKSNIIIGDATYSENKKYSTLAVLPDGSLRAFEAGETTAAQLRQMGVKDSFSFGPILVKDGVVDREAIRRHWKSDTEHSSRAALGQVEPGHYIAIVTKDAFTLPELAQLCADHHCTMAYNLDGGHSACMIFMGEQLFQSRLDKVHNVRQRPMPDLLLFGTNAAVPDMKDKVYSTGTDLYPKYKPKPTDGIIPEATASPGN